MEAADLAQINQTEKEDSEQDGKKEPHTRLRSLCENFQQQIQLALQWGAKVWPELYTLPGLVGRYKNIFLTEVTTDVFKCGCLYAYYVFSVVLCLIEIRLRM